MYVVILLEETILLNANWRNADPILLGFQFFHEELCDSMGGFLSSSYVTYRWKETGYNKSIKSTEIYINIERSIFEATSDAFTVKVAENPEEIKELLETGFEYVCQKENLVYLRKPK